METDNPGIAHTYQKKLFASGETETFDLWDRVGYIEITIGDNEPMVFTGLDFKFRITKVLANMVEGTMKVDIHGLRQDTINDIVTVCNNQEAIEQRKRIKIYAGYRKPEDPEYNGTLLACMDIIYASVTTPPPDLWVTIEGIQSAYYRFIKFYYKYDGGFKKVRETLRFTTFTPGPIEYLLPDANPQVAKTRIVKQDPAEYNSRERHIEVEKWYRVDSGIEDICNDLVECINNAFKKAKLPNRVEVEYYITDHTKLKRVESFVFNGLMNEITAKISTTFDVFCYLDYSYGDTDTLVIMDKTENIDQQEKSQLDRVNRNKKKIRKKVLDVEHGLIGIPSISNATSLKCRCLLDPTLSVGDYIDISSQVMPVVGSTATYWQINKVTFSGHMRGNEWYTDLTAADYTRMHADKNAGRNPVKVYQLSSR